MGNDPSSNPRVALLFTRYPVATETFLQREVAALKGGVGTWEVHSLWSLGRLGKDSLPDHVFTPWHLLSLVWWLPFWTIRAPRALWEMADRLLQARWPNPLNLFENLLGLGYAIVRAHQFVGRYDHLHAVWASAPAAAAWGLSRLTGIPYSMAGHAYDLFEDGGDGWLPVKIPEATFIRTSTESGKARWMELGAQPEQVFVIRRGLTAFPELAVKRVPSPPFQLLAVGRFVEKMGYPFIIRALAELRTAKVPFVATLVGEGPLKTGIQAHCARLQLGDRVVFTGALPYEKVEELFAEADVLLFGGTVARSGDRAGFPNAVGEAMAWGVPVCATPVGAILEGIEHGKSGLIATDPAEAARHIINLLRAPGEYQAMRISAREWAESAFDARRNMATFLELVLTGRPQTRPAIPGN